MAILGFWLIVLVSLRDVAQVFDQMLSLFPPNFCEAFDACLI